MHKVFHKAKEHVSCICGNTMIETTPRIAYGGNANCLCDECFVELNENDIMYHCTKKASCTQHTYGYDLCKNCVEEANKKSMKLVSHLYHGNSKQTMTIETTMSFTSDIDTAKR